MSEQRTQKIDELRTRLQRGRDMATSLMDGLRQKELLSASVDAVRGMVSPVRFDQYASVRAAVVPHRHAGKIFELG